MMQAAANTGEPPPTVIGQEYGGGFYAGNITDGGVEYYLVVAPRAVNESVGLQWKTTSTLTAGTSSVIDGPANTAAMIAAGAAAHPAADFCNNLTLGGFSDWYMPSRNELEICYYNLKPTADANNTSSGANPNAVPPRFGNYTSGVPAQTSVAAFQSGGAEAFDTGSYQTSLQNDALRAWRQSFLNGFQGGDSSKISAIRVRAVRRVPV